MATKAKSRRYLLHPFLFGIYPVLALLAHNIAEIPALEGIRALLAAFLLACLVFVGMYLLARDLQKAALLASLFLLAFFTYGHMLALLKHANLVGGEFGRHRFLAPVYLLGLLLAAWAVLRTRRDLRALTRALNWISLALILIPLLQITFYETRSLLAGRQESSTASAASEVHLTQGQASPDVYYILLDGYPRADFIAAHLGQDIAPFLSALEQRGFYIPRCGQSNYSDTRFSMAATLNMSYLDGGSGRPEVLLPASRLDEMIRYSAVLQNFEELGYQIVIFEPGFRWLNWAQPDYLLRPDDKNTGRGLASNGLNGFEYLLLNTTGGKLLLDGQSVAKSMRTAALDEFIETPRYKHRRTVEFALDTLPDTARSIPGPKFVYAHIVSPHPPFIYNAAGDPLVNSPVNELSAYGEQIVYLNSRILEVVDNIQANSDIPPVIIIQGDHGATIDYPGAGINESERLGILNALSLPGVNQEKFYPSITSVNTFRLIFDEFFNGKYGLLVDRSILGRQSPFIQLQCETSGQ